LPDNHSKRLVLVSGRCKKASINHSELFSSCRRDQIAQVPDGFFLVLHEDVVVDFQHDSTTAKVTWAKPVPFL